MASSNTRSNDWWGEGVGAVAVQDDWFSSLSPVAPERPAPTSPPASGSPSASVSSSPAPAVLPDAPEEPSPVQWPAAPPVLPHAQALVGLSPPVRLLLEAVAALAAQVPVELPRTQALAETAVLLAAQDQLRFVVLGRLGDVDIRGLVSLDDAPSTTAWVARQRTSLDTRDVTLARRLGRSPQVQQALADRRLTIPQARTIAAALGSVRRFLDRPDGLIDGVGADQVVRNVIVDGVRQIVCEAHAGLSDDDPRLAELIALLSRTADLPASQHARLEQAFVLLAERIEPGLLLSGLGRLVDAILPLKLEQRSADAHDERGLTLVRKPDGGWHIDADLDDECGELLHTLLTAEQAVDPDNPTDTAAWAELRETGWQTGDPFPDDPRLAAAARAVSADETRETDETATATPRSRRQQRHDAFRNGLRRALDSGVLGLRDKAVPHVNVLVTAPTLDGRPGSLPATGSSGQRLPLSLVRRWACDSALTRLVMSLGHKTIEASHTQRTLTALERKAKRAETGNRCQTSGCRCGPDATLIPHHAEPWATSKTTSLDDTVLLCTRDHHHLHDGHTLRLKDGRRLGPNGWVR